MALTDALDELIDVQLLSGQVLDLSGTANFIAVPTCVQCLVDRAFDANRLTGCDDLRRTRDGQYAKV